ncbi:hypothetical protein [Parasitella parasitica]|uniref:F-box domain-containing protein n=1 Tax=Parasitella parasitica TaxID=35722 RepID=A0A0B7NA13_9FUNG|nr:hypothetical protein [Parasitella parasitica]
MPSEDSDILTVQRAQYINWCNNRNFLFSPLVMPVNDRPMEREASKERSVTLPPELLLEIFGYLDNNQADLHSISLVCKQWFYCAAPILYCHPQIKDTYRWATFLLTLTRERMSFFYGDLIRSLDLSSGKSIGMCALSILEILTLVNVFMLEAMKDEEFYRRLSDANDSQQQQQHQRQRQRQFQRNSVATMDANNRFYIANRSNRDDEAERRREEHEYVVKGLPFIIVSTSSLIQVSNTCKNLTTLNLSYTSLLHDSVIAETGEYLSTLQRYAVQPGLTHIKIPIEEAIEAIGKSCCQLQEVKIQRCEWVTARVIWMFAYYCPNLIRLDARRSTKCTVKKLIANVLEAPGYKTYLYPEGIVNDDLLSRLPMRLRQRVVLEHTVQNEEDADHETEDDDEQEEGEDQNADVSIIRYRLNSKLYTSTLIISSAEANIIFSDETGLWEREANGQFVQDNDENVRNGMFWFIPVPNTSVEDEAHPVERRPPSPAQNRMSSEQFSTVDKRSLKDIIRTIIVEYKDLGGVDLNWIQDYQ